MLEVEGEVRGALGRGGSREVMGQKPGDCGWVKEEATIPAPLSALLILASPFKTCVAERREQDEGMKQNPAKCFPKLQSQIHQSGISSGKYKASF